MVIYISSWEKPTRENQNKKMKKETKTNKGAVTTKRITKKVATKKAAKKKAAPKLPKIDKFKKAAPGTAGRLVQLWKEKQKINCGEEKAMAADAAEKIGLPLATIARELGVALPLKKDGSLSVAKSALSRFNKSRVDLGMKKIEAIDGKYFQHMKATLTKKIEVDGRNLDEVGKQQLAIAEDKHIYGELSSEALEASIMKLVEKGHVELPIEFDDEMRESIGERIDYDVAEYQDVKYKAMTARIDKLEKLVKKLTK